MNASSSCRLELRPVVPALSVAIGGAALLALAAARIDWAWWLGAVVAAVACLELAWALRRLLRWRGLQLIAPDTLVLRDHRATEHSAVLHSWRRLGPFCLLDAELSGAVERIVVWCPGLPGDSLRQLNRTLRCMRGAPGATV